VKRALPTIATLLAGFVVQAALAPYLAIGDIVPNFFLLIVVTLALVEGPGWGAVSGFVAGLLFDLIGTGPVGPMALVLSVVGYATGTLQANLFAEGWLLPLTVLGIASITVELSYGLILGLLGVTSGWWHTFATVMLPEALYNVALGLLIYPVLARFLRRDRPMKTLRRIG
jgi:rod shape-determining protein MreD